MKNKSIEANRKRKRQFVDARGVATRQAVRHFGALADRAYFGARGHGKVGVQHFST